MLRKRLLRLWLTFTLLVPPCAGVADVVRDLARFVGPPVGGALAGTAAVLAVAAPAARLAPAQAVPPPRSWGWNLYGQLGNNKIRACFTTLTDRLLNVRSGELGRLCDETRAIGTKVARLRFVLPEALTRTVTLLANELLTGLLPGNLAPLSPGAGILPAEFVAGFCADRCTTILDEHERMRTPQLGANGHAEAELARTRRRLAENLEAERLRLARDLHDGAVQDLLAVRILLQAAAQSMAHGEDGQRASAADAMDNAAEHLLEVATKLRGLICELRPAGLDAYGLVGAMEGYVTRVRREAGDASLPSIVLVLPATDSRIPTSLARPLFRVAQEGLRNALRHASARTVIVTLGVQPGQITLSVEDDGAGFTVPASLDELTSSRHFGLVGLAEHLALLDGQFTVRSAPGVGTTLMAWLPFSSRSQQNGWAFDDQAAKL